MLINNKPGLSSFHKDIKDDIEALATGRQVSPLWLKFAYDGDEAIKQEVFS